MLSKLLATAASFGSGAVVAYYTCRNFEAESIYSESLQRKGAAEFDARLARLRVGDIMRPGPVAVQNTAPFADVAHQFLIHSFRYLFVVDADNRFRGAISLHDIKRYLNAPELARVLIAEDILRENFPTIAPDVELTKVLEEFSQHDGERLPVVSPDAERRLLGSVSKTDLLLALTGRVKTQAAGKPSS